MARRGFVSGRAVFLTLSIVYWVAALVVSYVLFSLESERILARMRDPLHFNPADHHLDHMSRAAGEQASEAQFVTLMGFASVYAAILLLWLILRLVRRARGR